MNTVGWYGAVSMMTCWGLSFRFTGHDDNLRRWLRQPGGHGHSAGGVEMK